MKKAASTLRPDLNLVAVFALTLAYTANASGPDDQAFPASFDLSQVVVRLERGQCHHINCPEYAVEIRGDGAVAYEGKSSVLIEGNYNWTIPQADVAALIDEFRKAGFFHLKDEYRSEANVESRLTIANKTKTVSTSMGGSICEPDAPTSSCVPERLLAMQAAIDRFSRATELTQGNGRTIALLEQTGFAFHSSFAASALLFALDKMNTEIAGELLSRGAPLNGGGLEPSMGKRTSLPAILLVPATADVKLAQSMIVGGALADTSTRQLFLLSSAASGSAAMTKLALEHYPDVRKKPASYPWVVAAATANMQTEGTHWQELYAKPEYALWKQNFDPPAVLRLLIAAGADPKAVDRDGNTALHLVQSGASAQVLLEAGADANAVNDKGRTPLHEARRADLALVLIRSGAQVSAKDLEGATPLFDCYDAKTARVLLQAGADVKYRAADGSTALFFQSDPETTAALVEAGADVNARLPGGLSALASASSTKSALVILRAGAKVPDDPARLEKLLNWAAGNNDEVLLRELQDRAASVTFSR
ncbi:MAG TPA: DUF6438 domain-containing protein [Steroidobacteraceae bacterium]|nr:DUF6438 domain-containing protein [Steroidobacteraceae bacterium]